MPHTNASNATSTQTSVSLMLSFLLPEPFPQPPFAAIGQIIDPLFVHVQSAGRLGVAQVLQIQHRKHAALIPGQPQKQGLEASVSSRRQYTVSTLASVR